MDEEEKICPECGNKVGLADIKCGACGFPLIKKSDKPISGRKMTCPECNRELSVDLQKCLYCGYPLKHGLSRRSSKKKKNIGIVFVFVGIVFLLLSFRTRFMGNYDYYESIIDNYENNIRGYEMSRQEMLDESRGYNSSFFKSSYQSLATGYQNLIVDAELSINEYKTLQRVILIKSAICLFVAIFLFGVGGCLIKKNNGKKA